MAQAAKKAPPFSIGQDIIDRYLIRQRKIKFVRNISESLESEEDLPESGLRFWYNDSMESYAPHWHAAFEMIVPVEGNYLVSIGEQTYDLGPGDIFVIPGGMQHSLRAPTRGSRFILLFDFDFLEKIKGSEYLLSCISLPILINRSTCPTICSEESGIVMQICGDYLQDDRMRDVAIYSRLLTFFLTYGKYCMSAEGKYPFAQYPQANQKNYTEKFNAVFAYMDRHYAEDLSLEHVAAVAGFSKFHFSRTFKQLSGFNFYDYLCQRRIRVAQSFLMQSDISVSQIALQSGFSSVSTFNRMFKKLTGCTPTQYRGMYQVQAAAADAADII